MDSLSNTTSLPLIKKRLLLGFEAFVEVFFDFEEVEVFKQEFVGVQILTPVERDLGFSKNAHFEHHGESLFKISSHFLHPLIQTVCLFALMIHIGSEGALFNVTESHENRESVLQVLLNSPNIVFLFPALALNLAEILQIPGKLVDLFVQRLVLAVQRTVETLDMDPAFLQSRSGRPEG